MVSSYRINGRYDLGAVIRTWNECEAEGNSSFSFILNMSAHDALDDARARTFS